MWTVSKTFNIEACHSLPHLPEGHKCRRFHGHRYEVTVVCEGDLEPENSWVIDYADIEEAFDKVIFSKLDHQFINDVINIPSTAENLAFWIYTKLKPSMPLLAAIEVKETEKTNVIYRET